MTIPAYVPLRTVANQDFSPSFMFLQVNGTAYDISTWTFELVILDDWGGTVIYTIPNSAIQNGGSSGIASPFVAASVMEPLGAIKGVYDLLATKSGPQSTVWFRGAFIQEVGSST